jgi:hypothetical protein
MYNGCENSPLIPRRGTFGYVWQIIYFLSKLAKILYLKLIK